MRILEHHALSTAKVTKQYQRVIAQLKKGDFAAADVRKMRNAPFYRAKLNDSHRLLFQIASFQGEKILLIVEIILNHNYQGSSFLKGAQICEEDFISVANEEISRDATELRYLNKNSTTFHYLGKPISFNQQQENLFIEPFPLIVIGSAGSGKTVLTLEKLKLLSGHVLYVSLSPYLVEASRRLFESSSPDTDRLEVEFLSFAELLASVRVPEGREISFTDFNTWCTSQDAFAKKNTRKIFEEFRGVLSGGGSTGGPLSREEYKQLGVKQSIFLSEERSKVYSIFERYLAWLPSAGRYDTTILAHNYKEKIKERYDSVVVDEVQDFTVPQLQLILGGLKDKRSFVLCGDSNQIVHPNFFSWSRVKSFFYSNQDANTPDIIHIMTNNFRNAKRITKAANRLLQIKQHRFGSIDKESNYLVNAISSTEGKTHLVSHHDYNLSKLNEASIESTKFAVLVLDDSLKEQARKHFETPLVFSIHEAKGLEYQKVILFSFVSSAVKEFQGIAGDLTREILERELKYGRAKDKTDKSLETLKFYINALYVGITRALEEVYLVEEHIDHNLWKLLNLPLLGDEFEIIKEKSSLEEWQAEARRLELQGKVEQAQDIKDRVLKIRPVPWEVPTQGSVIKLVNHVYSSESPKKKKLIELYELGIGTNLFHLNQIANSYPSAPTKDSIKARELMIDKYYMGYRQQKIGTLRNNLRSYGIDYRNEFGETPLIAAARLWNPVLVEGLLAEGASLESRTLGGLSPAAAVLRELLVRPPSNRELRQAVEVWDLLRAPITLRVEDQLIKIGDRLMEYLLFNLLCATTCYQVLIQGGYPFLTGIQLRIVYDLINKLPLGIAPERRRKNSYISSIFSKNEASGLSPYNRRIFVRGKRGHYLLNPRIMLRNEDSWVPIYESLGLSILKESPLVEHQVLPGILEKFDQVYNAEEEKLAYRAAI